MSFTHFARPMAVVAILAAAAAAQAASYRQGPIEVAGAWSRPAMAGSRAAGTGAR